VKRKWIIAGALACLLALTACQGKNDPAPTPFQTDLVQDMVEAGGFSETLEELDGDTAFALYKLADYGLVREDLTECAVLRSSGATCEEAAVLIFGGEKGGDAEAMTQVGQALKDYVQSQIDANTDYRPAEIPKLEQALVERRGDTLLLLVANDYQAAQSAIDESSR